MFWFRRPAYGKAMAAGALVLVAFAVDIRQGATEQYPFAAAAIARGSALTETAVVWRDVPLGLLPASDLPAGSRAARELPAGTPLVPAVVETGAAVPDGWWAVPVPLPPSIPPGSSVRLVTLTPPRAVDGIVVAPGGLGTFGVGEAGLVAVPATAATDVAVAAARNELTVLIAP